MNIKSKTYIAVPAEILGIILPLLLGVAFLVLAERKVMAPVTTFMLSLVAWAVVKFQFFLCKILFVFRFYLSELCFVILLVLLLLLFSTLGWFDLLQVLLSKVGFSLGGRALTCALLKLGMAGRLALAISCLVKGFLTAEGAVGNFMMPDAVELSAVGDPGCSNPGRGGDLADAVRPFLRGEASSSLPEVVESFSPNLVWSALDQPESMSLTMNENNMDFFRSMLEDADVSSAPAADIASSSSAPVVDDPVPPQADEVIGGDSIDSITHRLLRKISEPTASHIQMARYEAQDLFGVKVEIFRKMAVLDPTGDWLQKGARALESPHSKTGEMTLDKLYEWLSELQTLGVHSSIFRSLKLKVPLKTQ